jgi:hypothetical protein
MANQVTLEFAGDATKLQRASRDAQTSVESFASESTRAGREAAEAGAGANDYARSLGNIGEATTGALDGIDAMGGGLQAVADIQDYARDRAQRLARANVDVMQATEDMAQATRDAAQANIDAEQASLDLEQARLDEATALKDYNQAVKENGKNSDEAKQAKLDMAQASLDVLQAEEDAEQATRDLSQANIDAKTAQVDLNDAMHEANPPEIQEWADKVGMVTPLLSALVGVVGLVTAAQWAWNAAQLASPMTWIIVGIGAIIGIIALLVTKTEWGRKAWDTAWGGIKSAASAVGRWFRDTLWGSWIRGTWDRIKDKGQSVVDWMREVPTRLKNAFSKVTSFIFEPFRAAFNRIAHAWNATVGALSWTVPGWVPGIGGNSISVPNLPTFHQGGTVPGAPGSEVLAVLQAGEEVRSRSSVAAGGGDTVVVRGDAVLDAMIQAIADRVSYRGGKPAMLGLRVPGA